MHTGRPAEGKKSWIIDVHSLHKGRHLCRRYFPNSSERRTLEKIALSAEALFFFFYRSQYNRGISSPSFFQMGETSVPFPSFFAVVAKIALPPPLFWLAGIRNFPLAGLAQGGKRKEKGCANFTFEWDIHEEGGRKRRGGRESGVDGGRLAGLAWMASVAGGCEIRHFWQIPFFRESCKSQCHTR